MWVDSLFKAISEFFGFARQERDPEVVRINKIIELDKELDKERRKLDELLASDKNNPIEFGLCINRIIGLRRKKDSLRK